MDPTSPLVQVFDWTFSDGTHRIFDVAALQALCKTKEPEAVEVGPLASTVDWQAADWDHTEVRRCVELLAHPERLAAPVILASIKHGADEGWMLMDGRHRLYAHWCTGREVIAAYLLTDAEARTCDVTAQYNAGAMVFVS